MYTQKRKEVICKLAVLVGFCLPVTGFSHAPLVLLLLDNEQPMFGYNYSRALYVTV
jgi:hypothetical protein